MEGNHRDDAVEGAIREGERLRATWLESNRGTQLPSEGHLPWVRLEHDDLATARRESFRCCAGSAAHVKEPDVSRGNDEVFQHPEVRGPPSDAEELLDSDGERHDHAFGMIRRRSGPSRHFAAKDLAQHRRVDVPSGYDADHPSVPRLSGPRRRDGRATRAFRDDPIALD